MSQAQAAAVIDRLPWLEDEAKPARSRPPDERGRTREIAGWAVAATLLVAGAAYWMGAHSSRPSPRSEPTEATTTVPVPKPRATDEGREQQQPQLVLEPEPESSPAPIREAEVARPRLRRAHVERRSSQRHQAARPRQEAEPALEKVVSAQKAPPATVNPDSKPLTLWPASQSQGARGRIVRIGAFGSRQQAKLGWRYMVRAYPAVAHLPATVVEVRNSRGRRFYRFQIGTTSQAHSEVLCQRMGRIRFSCAVVGLPWSPTGVER